MEMLKKYWWAVLAVVVLYMTAGTKKKRRRTRRYAKRGYVRARRSYRGIRKRMRR